MFPTFGESPIGKLTADEIRRWHRPLRERIPSSAARAYQVVLALADIAHRRIRPMILVAGFGGLRYGELRGLRVRHYNRLKATVTVREAIDKRTRRKQPKTESSQRTVVLPRFVLDAIDDHLGEFVGGDPDGPLFPGEAGGIISDGWFQRESGAWPSERSVCPTCISTICATPPAPSPRSRAPR